MTCTDGVAALDECWACDATAVAGASGYLSFSHAGGRLFSSGSLCSNSHGEKMSPTLSELLLWVMGVASANDCALLLAHALFFMLARLP